MHMPFTGERYVPELRGQIYYEHLHRYALAFAIARDRDVLDIASGEGYGAAYLAIAARSTVGVDLDPASVRHAASRYTGMNLSFRVGSCTAIPLADASVDLVVSFETLEHIAEHDKFMREIVRVLRPDGELIISTPNKLVYSDHPGFENPFHVRELYFDEFRDLLRGFFPQVRLYGQRIVAGSAIHPLRGFAADARCMSPTTHENQRGLPALPAPAYFMAVCSLVDETVRPIKELDSVFLDPRDDLLADIVNPQPLTGGGPAGDDILALEGAPPELLAAFPRANHSAEPAAVVPPADAVSAGRYEALEAELAVERAAADDVRRRLGESEERCLELLAAIDHRDVALGQLHEQLRAVGAGDLDATPLPEIVSEAIADLQRRVGESEARHTHDEAETAKLEEALAEAEQRLRDTATERELATTQRDAALEQLRGLLNSLGVSDGVDVAGIAQTVSVAHDRIHASNASREHLLARATELESTLWAHTEAIAELERRLEESEAGRQTDRNAAAKQQELATAQRDEALEHLRGLLRVIGVSEDDVTAPGTEAVSDAYARLRANDQIREHLLAQATKLELGLSARSEAITDLQRRLEESEALRRRDETKAAAEQELATAQLDAALEQLQALLRAIGVGSGNAPSADTVSDALERLRSNEEAHQDLASHAAEAERELVERGELIADLGRRLDESEGRRRQHASEAEKLQQAIASAEQRLRDAANERDRMTARTAELESERGRTTRRITELEAERERAAAWIAELEAEHERVTAWTAELEAECESTTARIAELEAERERSTAWTAELEAECVHTTGRITQLEAERERTTGRITELEAERERATGRITELEAEGERATARITELEAEGERLLARIVRAVDELSQERRHGGSLEEQIAAAARSAKETQRYAEGLRERIAELEAALEEAQRRSAADAARSDELARALRDVKVELAGSKARFEQASMQLEEIAASRSWRVTKPLLLAMRPFRRV